MYLTCYMRLLPKMCYTYFPINKYVLVQQHNIILIIFFKNNVYKCMYILYRELV